MWQKKWKLLRDYWPLNVFVDALAACRKKVFKANSLTTSNQEMPAHLKYCSQRIFQSFNVENAVFNVSPSLILDGGLVELLVACQSLIQKAL